MLSLRSLAFILCSAIRRARALSSSAFHCFPDRINGRKMAINMDTNMDTNTAASMCSLLQTAYPFLGDHGPGPQRTLFRTAGSYDLLLNAVGNESTVGRGLPVRAPCATSDARWLATLAIYVASYIFRQAQTDANNPHAVGTGGTPFMPYLKKHRDETAEHRLAHVPGTVPVK
jgi:hypothetical protein